MNLRSPKYIYKKAKQHANSYLTAASFICSLVLAFCFQFGLNQTENLPLTLFQITCLSGFILGSIYIVKYAITDRSNISPKLLLILTVVLFSIYWLPQGIDITDEGRILLIASRFSEIPVSNYMKERYGSILLSWLWNGVTGFKYIFWSRLGYVVLTTSTIVVFYLWIKSRFQNRIAILTTLIGFLCYTVYQIYTINYNTTPIFFTLLSLYVLDKPFKIKLLNPFLGVVFILFAGLCKVSFFTFFIPLISAYVLFPPDETSRESAVINLAKTLGILLFVVLIYLKLNLELTNTIVKIKLYLIAKLSGLDSNDASGHNLGGLLRLYLDQIQLLWPWVFKSFLICFGALLFSAVKFKYSKNIIGVIALVSLFQLLDPLQFFWHSILSLTTALGMLSIVVGIGKKHNLKWIFWSVPLYCLTFFGSNNGLQNIIYTGGILPLVAISLGILFSDQIKIKHLTFNPKPIAISLTLLLAYFCIDRRMELVYRDGKRTELTQSFKSPQLIGIYSTQQRVKEIDSFLEYVEENVKRNETIAHYNTIPMIAYLSSRASNVHRECCKVPLAADIDLSHDYYLLNTKNSRNSKWPLNIDIASSLDTLAYNSHKILVEKSYTPVFIGKALVVYKNNEF